MVGEKLKDTLTSIESNLNFLIEGLKQLQSVEKDQKKNKFAGGTILMTQGILSRIKGSTTTVDVTDDAALARIDSHVEQSHFTDFCKAFESAVICLYPKKNVLGHEEKVMELTATPIY